MLRYRGMQARASKVVASSEHECDVAIDYDPASDMLVVGTGDRGAWSPMNVTSLNRAPTALRCQGLGTQPGFPSRSPTFASTTSATAPSRRRAEAGGLDHASLARARGAFRSWMADRC